MSISLYPPPESVKDGKRLFDWVTIYWPCTEEGKNYTTQSVLLHNDTPNEEVEEALDCALKNLKEGNRGNGVTADRVTYSDGQATINGTTLNLTSAVTSIQL